MSIVRVKKHSHNFVLLDTTCVNDARMSFKAKGLHAYLMSKPDNWEISIKQLETQSPREARDAIAAGLQELVRFGYAVRVRHRATDGKLGGWETTVYEVPITENGLAEVGLSVLGTENGLAEVGLSVLGTENGLAEVGLSVANKDCIHQGLKKEERSSKPPPSPSPEGRSPADSSPLTPQWLLEVYNRETPPTHPKAHTLSPARRKKATVYLRLFPERGFWLVVFREISQSRLLQGLNPRQGHEGFKATFDWLLTKGKDGTENCVKVFEGRYRDDPPRQAKTSRGAYMG